MTSLHPVDVSTMDGCQRLVDFALGEHGRIDVLFNNAARAHFNWIEDISEDEWRQNSREKSIFPSS
jgi:NAD(P)-dependent dehydrogenase (short-subunit alcohol dehydrogenase family)